MEGIKFRGRAERCLSWVKLGSGESFTESPLYPDRASMGHSKMSGEHPELDDLQAAYKSAVETWIASIRREEELASAADHSVTRN
jgi:hypothetical protein